ncbi:MAG: beta-galactosidase, partial [Cyclobacteriaceae bacterium]|nr:beta-galactosidase [Cyclobacteriaceae bacterium]
ELIEKYLQFIDKLVPMIDKGLAAAVYTQTTDVEVETNGLMSYDREVMKMPVNKLAEAHLKLTKPNR